MHSWVMRRFSEPTSPLAGAWILTAAIVVGTLATESLPVVFGRGASARVDWSIVYVTARFVVLPITSLFNLWLSVWALIQSARSEAVAHSWAALGSAAVPLSFLVLSYFHPLFWFSFLVS